MANLAKQIRDKKDKEMIKKMTGKTPKHRCPVCHRFTLWMNDKQYKNQCLMCKIIEEERKNKEGVVND